MRSWGTTRRPALVIVLVATVAALPGSPAWAAPADAVTSPTSWSANVQRPGVPSCESGEQPVVPSTSATDLNGLTTVKYGALPGLHVDIPPPNYDPASASPGLNTSLRVSDRSMSETMSSNLVKSLKQLAKSRVAPAFCYRSVSAGTRPLSLPGRVLSSAGTAPGSSCAKAPCASHVNSSNWSGYVVSQGAVPYTIYGATAAWFEQSSGYDTPHNKDVTWVGVGGATPGAAYGLIQAGTSMETNAGYRSWFEWVGSGTGVGEQFASIGGVLYSGGNVVRPGDLISTIVYWSKHVNDSEWDMCFTVADLDRSSGDLNGCQPRVPPPGHPQFGKAILQDHSSVEWIDEKDTAGYPLSDFWQTNFFGAGLYNPAISSSIDDFNKYSYTGWILGTGVPKATGATLYDRCTSTISAFPANPVRETSSGNGGSFTNQFCNP